MRCRPQPSEPSWTELRRLLVAPRPAAPLKTARICDALHRARSFLSPCAADDGYVACLNDGSWMVVPVHPSGTNGELWRPVSRPGHLAAWTCSDVAFWQHDPETGGRMVVVRGETVHNVGLGEVRCRWIGRPARNACVAIVERDDGASEVVLLSLAGQPDGRPGVVWRESVDLDVAGADWREPLEVSPPGTVALVAVVGRDGAAAELWTVARQGLTRRPLEARLAAFDQRDPVLYRVEDDRLVRDRLVATDLPTTTELRGSVQFAGLAGGHGGVVGWTAETVEWVDGPVERKAKLEGVKSVVVRGDRALALVADPTDMRVYELECPAPPPKRARRREWLGTIR